MKHLLNIVIGGVLVTSALLPVFAYADEGAVPIGQPNPVLHPCVVIPTTIDVGANDTATSDSVTKLQQFLEINGVLTKADITGHFGQNTAAALKKFQAKKGLESVGTAGPKTRALMGKGCAPVPQNRAPVLLQRRTPLQIASTTNVTINSPSFFAQLADFFNPVNLVANVINSIWNLLADVIQSTSNSTEAGSASFLNTDSITSGSWKGVYGSEGYNVIDDQAQYPSYAKVSVQDNLTYLWSPSASDPKDLQKSATSATDRIAATWYSPNAFTIDLNLTDNQPHQVSFYILDWDARSRAQKIDVLDMNGNILDSQTVSQFNAGKYLTWTLSGHVKLRFTNLASPTTANSVLSGIFFGAKSVTTVPTAPTSPTVPTAPTTPTAPTAPSNPTTNVPAPSSNLIGYWSMDNSTISGSSLVDQSGNNYNGILFNAPTSVTGAFGQALQFNGINTFINLPASTFGNYPMTGNASDYGLSFAVWFKTTDKGVILGQNNHNYFPPASPGSYVPAIYIDTNSKLRASMFWHLGSDSGQIVSVKSYNDGNWHLLVDAYGSGVENLYVDGQNIGSQTKNQYSYASFYSYFLGTGYASGWPNTTASWFYYKGLLDEAKIYNRALSAGEVKTLYSALPTSVTTPPADTTVPTVVIVSPVASQSVSGAVNVNVQATDNVGVSKVELYINSVLYGTDTSAPYAFSWSAPAATSTTQNFTLVAKAYDAAGNIGASTPTVLSVAAVLPPPVSSGSAFFLNADPITSGSWKGIYGSDGYNVIGDQVNYPNYAKVSVQDNLTYLWSSSASDSKDLQKSATTATDRIAGTWYSPNAFTVDLNLIDNQPHQVSFYILDWDPRSRAQKIDVLDTSGNILDSQTVSQFSTGKYLTWTLTGHVKFRFTNLASPTTANSVLSGIFFGAKNTTTVPVAPTSPATSTPPVVTNPISNPTAGAVAVQIKNMVSFNELYIDGSPADDTISISQSGSAITVLANGSSQAFNGPFGDIVIKGEDGNDQINIDGSVTTRVLAYGNNGNNTITAAGSARVVAVTVGGGKDSITGNSNTTYWVGTEDAAHYSNNALIAGKVNIINSFYQPWTTNQSSSDYIPLALAGQKLKDPSDPSNNVVTLTDRSLFGQGPTINDIVQGRLADCYWDAGLAGLAYVVPDRLEDTGVDLGDGTYLVRFIRNNTPSFVRVDSDFDLLNNISGPNGNIWGMVYEKAYAFFRKGANTYDSLNYGFPSEWSGLGFVNDTLSPKQNVVYSNVTTNLSAKHPLDICTSGLTILDGAPVTSSHCYTVTNATASPTVTLRNPWGIDGVGNDGADDGFVTLTGTQVQDNINSINAAR